MAGGKDRSDIPGKKTESHYPHERNDKSAAKEKERHLQMKRRYKSEEMFRAHFAYVLGRPLARDRSVGTPFDKGELIVIARVDTD